MFAALCMGTIYSVPGYLPPVFDRKSVYSHSPIALTVFLRVQIHAHACIFGWLLGDCISETTADIPRNQRSMLQDWCWLYTLQIMSAESARRKCDGRC